jgi:hypothetical protein
MRQTWIVQPSFPAGGRRQAAASLNRIERTACLQMSQRFGVTSSLNSSLSLDRRKNTAPRTRLSQRKANATASR